MGSTRSANQIAQAEQAGDWTKAMGLKDELSIGLASYAEEQRRGPYTNLDHQ